MRSRSVSSGSRTPRLTKIQLVHRPEEKVQDDARTQECLVQAKAVRKQIIRYIQLVEDEEVIGTLIESNERIIAALEMYDQVCDELLRGCLS